MYQINTGLGVKWLALLAIVVMGAIFALGFNIKDATWLNGKISTATADRMEQQTSMDIKNAVLDYKLRKAKIDSQIELEKQTATYKTTQLQEKIELEKQTAAYKTAQLQQELEAQATKNIQDAELRLSFQNVVNSGTILLFFSFSFALLVLTITGSIGIYQRLRYTTNLQIAKSASTQISNPWTSPQFRKQARLTARQTELRKIHNKLAMKKTFSIWPDSGQSGELKTDSYPSVN